MTSPYFSIIVPTYNRGQLIGRTINSVLKQTFLSFELVIIDDGSTDNTTDVVGAFTDERVRYQKVLNGERGRARNIGTRMAKGKYITFLDSDDILYPDHLTNALQFCEENDSPEVFHLGYEIKTEQGKVLTSMRFFPKTLNNRLLKGNIMSCMNVFLRKDIASEFLFEESKELAGTEDWLLWLRLAARFPIHHLPVVTSALIHHKGRSVNSFSEDALIARTELLIENLLDDEEFMEKYGAAAIARIKAHMFTYISLHAIASGAKREGVKYFRLGIKTHPGEIWTRRSLAIVKNFIFS